MGFMFLRYISLSDIHCGVDTPMCSYNVSRGSWGACDVVTEVMGRGEVHQSKCWEGMGAICLVFWGFVYLCE